MNALFIFVAQDAGLFKAEIAPIEIMEKKKPVLFEVDEHPRPQTTLEGLAKLPTLFKKNGVVTAGSASVSIPLFCCIFASNLRNNENCFMKTNIISRKN